MSPDGAPLGFPTTNRRYERVRVFYTEETAVPAIPLYVIALELKYLLIIAEMVHRDDPLHLFTLSFASM
jgi:hypothetical protein